MKFKKIRTKSNLVSNTQNMLTSGAVVGQPGSSIRLSDTERAMIRERVRLNIINQINLNLDKHRVTDIFIENSNNISIEILHHNNHIAALIINDPDSASIISPIDSNQEGDGIDEYIEGIRGNDMSEGQTSTMDNNGNMGATMTGITSVPNSWTMQPPQSSESVTTVRRDEDNHTNTNTTIMDFFQEGEDIRETEINESSGPMPIVGRDANNNATIDTTTIGSMYDPDSWSPQLVLPSGFITTGVQNINHTINRDNQSITGGQSINSISTDNIDTLSNRFDGVLENAFPQQ